MLAHAFFATPNPQTGRPRLGLVAGAAGQALPRVTLRELVRLRLAEPAVQEQFVADWAPVVAREVRYYAARGGQADELAAEGSLALWEAAQQYEPGRHRTAPERYIQNHIHRRVRQAYREALGFGRPAVLPASVLEQEARPDEQLGAVEQAVDLAGAVGALKPAEQAEFGSFVALRLSGMGPDEAARAISAHGGSTFGATKKRLERIRKKVAASLSRPLDT